jgi:hypothetical protein
LLGAGFCTPSSLLGLFILTSELYSLSMYYKDTLFSFFWIVWLCLASLAIFTFLHWQPLPSSWRPASACTECSKRIFIHLRVEGSDVPYQKRIEEGGSRLPRPAPAGGDRDGEGHDGEVSPVTFVLYILWASAIGGLIGRAAASQGRAKMKGFKSRLSPTGWVRPGQGSTMLERTTKYELPASVELNMCIMCSA